MFRTSDDRESLEAQLILLQGELEEHGEGWGGAHETRKTIELVQERLRHLTRAADLSTDREALEEEVTYLLREITELVTRGGTEGGEAVERLTDRIDEIERVLLELDEASADE